MRKKQNHIFGLIMIVAASLVLTAPLHVWGETVELTVSQSSDDAEQRVSDGTMSLTSTDLAMVNPGSEQVVGIRFQNVSIPMGATVTNAYIMFTADEKTSESTTLTIAAHNIGNAPAFTAAGYDISNRPQTGASVTWDVPEWGSMNESGVKQQTPDLSSVVNAIVNSPDWSSGNAMAFIVTGSGNRVARSYEKNPPNPPLLHVEYTENILERRVSGNDDDAEEDSNRNVNISGLDLAFFETGGQAVGIRFQNVTVPPGAIITKAYIQFVADGSEEDSTVIAIRGQASNNAESFSPVDSDITNRPTTYGEVVWGPVADWDNGQTYHTPSLAALVQEIAGRSGWSSGNAMAFIFTEDLGLRIATSFDEDPTKAPLLRIEYSEVTSAYITLNKNHLGAICYEESNANDASFTITNSGAAAMSYTTTDNAAWLALSSGSGTLGPGQQATITVTYNTSGLSAGTHEATITVADPDAWNSPAEIHVSVAVQIIGAASLCGNVPIYAARLVTPAVLVLLDVSSSMKRLTDVSPAEDNPRTPPLTTVVQEIVDRSGWQPGNAMAFIITGSGKRSARSYDNVTSVHAPLLHVAYTDSEGTGHEIDIRVSSSDDDAEENADDADKVRLDSNDMDLCDWEGSGAVGLRFQDVTIPQGATITNAFLEFVVHGTNSEDTSWTIRGQDFDNPPPFAEIDKNITDRTPTTASVAWNSIEPWTAATQEMRITLGQEVINTLVKDKSISWGFGTWSQVWDDDEPTCQFQEEDDYTWIHEGAKPYSALHEQALHDAINSRVYCSGTPFYHSLVAARKYFSEEKKDQDGAGENFVPIGDCQSKFLIEVTDGEGEKTQAEIEQATRDLTATGVTAIAVGFGVDDQFTHIDALAAVANEEGHVSEDDDVYALHTEAGGVGRPFLAYSRDELLQALSKITESIKGATFHGSSPAVTTSADLGDTVIVARFDPTGWSGDVLRLDYNHATDLWDTIDWTASEEMPGTRSVFTVDPSDHTTAVAYTDSVPGYDNYMCKPIGDIINSSPVVVGSPAFYYPFDGYTDWKAGIIRDPLVYIGANDGSLHAFSLADGQEKWAFVPENFQAKLALAGTDSSYDMCDDDYCHLYFVDGSPQVADIYQGSTWKTILVCGEREGGEAYFALDITHGNTFDAASEKSKFLWQFTDTELGQTWAEASIDRVAEGESATWAVFFGSGYSPADQANKLAYMYGLVADTKDPLWNQSEGEGGGDINRIVMSNSKTNNALSAPLVVDLDADDISDRIYTGDLYGTMYRILDIGKDENPDTSKLFDFSPTKATPDKNPIRAKAAFAYGQQAGNIWVYFGTGRYETEGDKIEEDQQYFFGIKDAVGSTTEHDLSDLALLQTEYVEDVSGKKFRRITGSNDSSGSWVIQLDTTSSQRIERVIVKPIVEGGIVFFVTFIPDPDPCEGSGQAWLYAVSYDTGLAPAIPVFDLDGDGDFDADDRAVDLEDNVHHVAGISIGKGQGSSAIVKEDHLFATTTVGGLSTLKVNLPKNKVKAGYWKENF